MPSLIVCTPGGSTDNSYVTLAQADAYFAVGLRNDTWQTQWDDADKERALIDATANIEAQGGARLRLLSPARPLFPGMPYDTGSTNGVANQALHFPRTTDSVTISGVVTKQVPVSLKAAVCEQALWLLETRDSPDLLDRAALRGQGVTAINVDGLSESYGVARIPAGIAPLAWQHLRSLVQSNFGIV